MAQFPYTIFSGSPRAGRVFIGGREVSFDDHNRAESDVVAAAAIGQFIETGATDGVVTVSVGPSAPPVVETAPEIIPVAASVEITPLAEPRRTAVRHGDPSPLRKANEKAAGKPATRGAKKPL